MFYLNQLEYRHIPYAHNLKNGGADPEHSNVAAAGCGPCCLCMMVENMTCRHLGLEECLELSAQVEANLDVGTDLKILGAAVAEKFGLDFAMTSDRTALVEHLQAGGLAVANSGGDREGYTGLFTHGGHYILVVSVEGETACILDPSYKPGKFDEEGRSGKVKVDEPFVYCPLDVLAQDCANRNPSYYLFKRRRPE